MEYYTRFEKDTLVSNKTTIRHKVLGPTLPAKCKQTTSYRINKDDLLQTVGSEHDGLKLGPKCYL